MHHLCRENIFLPHFLSGTIFIFYLRHLLSCLAFNEIIDMCRCKAASVFNLSLLILFLCCSFDNLLVFIKESCRNCFIFTADMLATANNLKSLKQLFIYFTSLLQFPLPLCSPPPIHSFISILEKAGLP